MNPFARLLLDLGPLVAFFVAYWQGGIMVATAVFMAATVAALATGWAVERRVAKMPLVTAVIVMLFGGLTLALDDATFIKLKPTIVYLSFAVVLLGGLAIGRNMVKPLMESAIRMREEGWRILALRWGGFFLVMAALNEAVWRTQSEAVWVDVKVFGFLPVTLAFALAQMPLIRRYALDEEGGASSGDQDVGRSR